MSASKCFFYTLCAVIIFLGVSGLILPPSSFGKNSPPAEQQEEDGSPGQGDEHRADPCDHLPDPPGNAKGIDKQCPPFGSSGGVAKGDFNGDGFADLAVGVPFEDRNGVGQVGAVNIIYGSSAGLTATADQFFDETTFGFPYHSNDHFGAALAAGDFNGDDFSDLAIGIPGWDASTVANAGAVVVISGSAGGLDTSTVRGVGPLTGGRAGAALVWADFNGDGFGDLAVGVPDAFVVFQDALTCISPGIIVNGAGAVHVFYGSSTGLKSSGAQFFQEGPKGCGNPSNVGLQANENDHFGSTLAAGHFHGGAAADLVIGVPFKDIPFTQDAGAVFIVPGGATKLRAAGTQDLDQNLEGVKGTDEAGDQFGRALATGDFDGDGRDDLAVGVPFEDVISNSKADAGAVQVFFGSRSEELVTTDGNMFIEQSSIPDISSETGDLFGWALAVGDFDGDGHADLAIGSPGEDVFAITDAGLVTVLYGSSSGPSLTRVQHWTQNSAGLVSLDLAEPGDQFGYALSAWNYGNGGESDLAIGVPFEDIVSSITGTLQPDAGAVNLIYGSPNGLSATAHPAQFWHQDSPGIRDAAQTGDRFGSTLY